MKTGRRRTSIAFLAAIAMVLVTTVVLAFFTYWTDRAERARQMARLRVEQDILADHLAVSLALPIWNFDRAQIDKVIESGMQARDVSAIVVRLADANRTVHARSRNEKWKIIPITGEPAEEGLLTTLRNVMAGGDTVGTVKTFMTPKFQEAELAEIRRQWIFQIAAFHALLILCLYLLLWRLVIKPVQTLERHAAAVSAENGQTLALEGAKFHGELETLRESLDTMMRLLHARHAAVRESEERFQLAVRGSADGIWDWNLLTNEVFYSNRIRELLGYTEAEFPNAREAFESLLEPTDKIRALEAVAPHLQDRSPYDVEFRLRTRGGAYRWFRSRGQAVWDAANKPVRMAGSITDMTERKQIEAELHEMTARIMEIQDEERRKIGRDLHDSTGQTLAALEINLGILFRAQNAAEPRREQLLSQCIELATKCSTEIRTTSYLLHPPLLDEIGLKSALRWYVDGFSHRSKIAVDLSISESIERLPPTHELSLFRVVQEALTNIHRHSGSPTASIRLDVDESRIVLEVADQGCGISAEKLRSFRKGHSNLGVGLAGMRERIQQLGGDFQIESNGQGSRVRVSLLRTKIGDDLAAV